MYSAADIAKYFLFKASLDEDYLTNLKLQKLLYYAQGFSLVLNQEKLFPEDLVAWHHGPVVVAVYEEYKKYGLNCIIPKKNEEPSPALVENSPVKELLDEVYEVYGQFSAGGLRNLIHRESPWLETQIKETITPEKMIKFFKTRIR